VGVKGSWGSLTSQAKKTGIGVQRVEQNMPKENKGTTNRGGRWSPKGQAFSNDEAKKKQREPSQEFGGNLNRPTIKQSAGSQSDTRGGSPPTIGTALKKNKRKKRPAKIPLKEKLRMDSKENPENFGNKNRRVNK